MNELILFSCPPKNINPRTERVEAMETPGKNGLRELFVRPATAEEIAAYDSAHQHDRPGWVEFGAALQSSEPINELLMALQQLPAVGLGLAVGLSKAADGDARVFLSSWTMARNLGLITDELLAGVLSMAAGFDLPAAFIEALTVPPPAQALGQGWTSPTGTLYRVAQATGEDGQFLPDDPGTPPRESLRWLVVEP